MSIHYNLQNIEEVAYKTKQKSYVRNRKYIFNKFRIAIEQKRLQN